MAKASKSDDKGAAKSNKPKPAAEAAAKKAPAKPKAGAPAAKSGGGKAAATKAGRGGGGAGSSGASPMIDTNLAAQAAAKMLTAGLPSRNAAGGASGGAGGGKPQSAMFKQMKDGLSKPHLSGMNNLLDKSAPTGSKRPDQLKGPQQIGHNQTFGADVNRAGVPRRTPG